MSLRHVCALAIALSALAGCSKPSPALLSASQTLPPPPSAGVAVVVPAEEGPIAGDPVGGAIALAGGRIKVDAERRTSHAKIWAGGDCVAGGDDLTVSAVADGREAAISIDRVLRE